MCTIRREEYGLITFWSGVEYKRCWDPQICLEKGKQSNAQDTLPTSLVCSSPRTPLLRHCYKRWETPWTTWEHYSSITCIASLFVMIQKTGYETLRGQIKKYTFTYVSSKLQIYKILTYQISPSMQNLIGNAKHLMAALHSSSLQRVVDTNISYTTNTKALKSLDSGSIKLR